MVEPISGEIDKLGSAIVDAAFSVHKQLGPGLLESVYEVCLCHELAKRGIAFERQVALPVVYDGVRLDAGLRLDLLVAKQVIVEVKAVEKHHPVYEAQLLTYLRLTRCRLGFVINFNVVLIKQGIKRIAL